MDELTYLRTQTNFTWKVPRDAPVNATTLTLHAPTPLLGGQATLLPTPTCLAEHRRKDDSSDSILTPTSEASPDVTTSKVVPIQRPGKTPAVTSRREEACISSGEQLAIQSFVIKGPASTPSRPSSVSLESLLAVDAGSPEGQRQVEDVGVEGLPLIVSPWIDSPSPIAQRPAEKCKSSREAGHDRVKRTAKEAPEG